MDPGLHFGAPGRLHTIHEPTHLKIGGGLDDVWLNSDTGRLHIVDYRVHRRSRR